MITATSLILAQVNNNDLDAATAAAAGIGLAMLAVYGVILLAFLIGRWMVFSKAGQPGWASIIPIFDLWVMVQVARKEALWFILLFVPCVNIVAVIMLCLEIAKNFGKGAGYGLGLAFLPFIFWPILGFGSAKYQPAAGGAAAG